MKSIVFLLAKTCFQITSVLQTFSRSSMARFYFIAFNISPSFPHLLNYYLHFSAKAWLLSYPTRKFSCSCQLCRFILNREAIFLSLVSVSWLRKVLLINLDSLQIRSTLMDLWYFKSNVGINNISWIYHTIMTTCREQGGASDIVHITSPQK